MTTIIKEKIQTKMDNLTEIYQGLQKLQALKIEDLQNKDRKCLGGFFWFSGWR